MVWAVGFSCTLVGGVCFLIPALNVVGVGGLCWFCGVIAICSFCDCGCWVGFWVWFLGVVFGCGGWAWVLLLGLGKLFVVFLLVLVPCVLV